MSLSVHRADSYSSGAGLAYRSANTAHTNSRLYRRPDAPTSQ